jgi:CheY-like chemotaxis protein
VQTPGLKGKLGEIDCAVGNLSATGALLLARHEVQLETSWPLMLRLPGGSVQVGCRVVRCESMEIDMPGAVWRRRESAIGALFDHVEPAASQAIQRFCQTSASTEESQPRVLVVGTDSDLSKVISGALADGDYVPRVLTDIGKAPAVAKRMGAKVIVLNLEGGPAMFNVLDALRSNRSTRDVPLVACASLARLPERQRTHLSAQRVRVLALPLTPEELIDAVDQAVLTSLNV